MRTPPLLLAGLLLSPACGDKDEGDGYDPYTDDGDGDGFPGSSDCDDANPDVFPDADEYCNGIDDDCDGDIDEKSALDSVVWYYDDDGDGYGNEIAAQRACYAPTGFVADATDCDDDDATSYPEAPELCDDGADNDCDGLGDCEDGACTEDPVCDEIDCEDGIDDDEDGLTDCEDDACWGTIPCAEWRTVHITGGEARAKRHTYLATGNGADLVWHWTTWRAWDVSGTARIGFSDHTETCTWTLGEGTGFAYTRFSYGTWSWPAYFYPATMTRSSFVASSACPFGDSMLPAEDDWLFSQQQTFTSPSGATFPAMFAGRVTATSSSMPLGTRPMYAVRVTDSDIDGWDTSTAGYQITYQERVIDGFLGPWLTYSAAR